MSAPGLTLSSSNWLFSFRVLVWNTLVWGTLLSPPLSAQSPLTPTDTLFSQTDTLPSRTKWLRVIGTNDFHGHLTPTTPTWAEGRQVGGAGAIAAYFAQARAETDAPTLLLDGGDIMQGTPLSNLTEGRATVAFYNAVGYTAAAIGNHEFDWGAEVLRDRNEEAEFAWLGANIFLKETGEHPDFVVPIRELTLPGCRAVTSTCDSIQVGIIGVATQTTPTVALPSHVAPFNFEEEWIAIDRWVPILRERGADFVIVVAHEGVYCVTSPNQECSGRMLEIVERLQHLPDLIVGGHTHAVVDIQARGVHIVEGGAYGGRFSVVDLERVSSDSVAVYPRAQPIVWADEHPQDTTVLRILAPYWDEVGHNLEEVLATTSTSLFREGTEYALGNLIADAQREATGADVAIINNGGIRTEIAAGPITYADLFRVQPFGNTLVILDLSREQLLAAIEHSLSGGRSSSHISGLSIHFRRLQDGGVEIIDMTLDNDLVMESGRTYRVAVNNFLAEGGDGYTMFLDAASTHLTGIVDLDALITYLKMLGSPLLLPPVGRLVPMP